mmetsp:Transcript_19329/g.59703  ORF Transcript_19329/g.59703 Transcript_19329/m.59703 type:complete len:284 (+) Transcript_19329:279-1130(+)
MPRAGRSTVRGGGGGGGGGGSTGISRVSSSSQVFAEENEESCSGDRLPVRSSLCSACVARNLSTSRRTVSLNNKRPSGSTSNFDANISGSNAASAQMPGTNSETRSLYRCARSPFAASRARKADKFSSATSRTASATTSTKRATGSGRCSLATSPLVSRRMGQSSTEWPRPPQNGQGSPSLTSLSSLCSQPAMNAASSSVHSVSTAASSPGASGGAAVAALAARARGASGRDSGGGGSSLVKVSFVIAWCFAWCARSAFAEHRERSRAGVEASLFSCALRCAQ